MHIEQKQDRIFKPNSIYTLSAEETNQQTTELEGLISHAGLTPSASDLTQVSQAVDALIDEATPIATSSTIGLVKPDNETVTVASDGTLTAVGGGTGSGKQIGEVFYSQSSSAQDNPGALPLFTGETISNADQVYPDFYAWVLAHTELQISAADYQTALSTYGECPKYVIDDTNKTIRLAKLTNYIKMANTTDGITQSAAGLPNITGETTATNIGNYVSGGTGAFIQKQFSSTNTGVSNGRGVFGNILDFDASRSSDVYGKSDTNTPAHTTLFPWVCAYNAAVPASTAQAAEFQAALTSKADVDFSNITTAAKKVVFGRAFTPANITIAKGNASIAGTYTLTDLPDDGVVRLVLLNCRLILGANNRSSMAIQTDVMNNYIIVAETNNSFTASGAVLVPMIRQVTLSFPQISGGVMADTEFMFRGYI